MVERESEPPAPPPRDYLAEYHAQKHSKANILGADECGYGSWAGPLVVCAAAIRHNWTPPKGLNDSKKFSRRDKREEMFEYLKTRVPYAVSMAHSDEVDRQGVVLTLRRCYREAINSVRAQYPDSLIVIDGLVRIPGLDHLFFPKADGIVPAVMAASIIGKVLHDQYMWRMAEKYPGYGFHEHQGYGTKKHREAIERLGLCPIHRVTYIKEKTRTVEEMRAIDEVGISVD